MLVYVGAAAAVGVTGLIIYLLARRSGDEPETPEAEEPEEAAAPADETPPPPEEAPPPVEEVAPPEDE